MSFTLALDPFKELVKERCGLSCEGHSEEKLAHALAERSAALAIQTGDYYGRLISNDAEFQELVNLLTINETYFFREPEQIRLLVDRLAPCFLAAHAGSAPVRILSAGCSSGEEPYSLAMALIDKYGESVSRLFTFAGGDIDSSVLAKARNGRYTDFSFRGVSPDVRSRYFDKDRWGNLLKEPVKILVSFHELNLLANSFPPALHSFDIIFFRNVSIYFDTPTRKIIQHNLASLMKEDGVLVIGTAETLANDLGVLPLVEDDGFYYFVKGHPSLPQTATANPVAHQWTPLVPSYPEPTSPLVSAAPILPLPTWSFLDLAPPLPSPLSPVADFGSAVKVRAAPVFPSPTLPPVVDRPGLALESARQLTRDKRYDDALPFLDVVLGVDPGNTEAQLLKAHVLMNHKDFAAVEDLAQRVLAVDAWSVDALLLLGLASKWRQQGEAAIRWFKQAAYARHECWPAHYYLADLYRNRGENELARRAYRAVIQLLSGPAPETGIKIVPLGLPEGEVRFLCEHQLAKLPGAKTSAGPR
jgi:chemotaxis protein methyltransferase CheR